MMAVVVKFVSEYSVPKSPCGNSSGRGENGDFRASERSVHKVREHRSAEKRHLQTALMNVGMGSKINPSERASASKRGPRIRSAKGAGATMATAQAESLRPPSRFLFALELRALPELGGFLASLPLLTALTPRGDGHPVLVLPGLVTSDRSTIALRNFLRARAGAAHGWELGRNYGPLLRHRARHDRQGRTAL